MASPIADSGSGLENASGRRIAGAKGDFGGVWFEGPLEMGMRVCLRARVAVRVLVQLATFDAPDAAALYAGARTVAWRDWLTAKSTLSVHGSVRDTLEAADRDA